MDHFSMGGGEVAKKQKSVSGAQGAKVAKVPELTETEKGVEYLRVLKRGDFPKTVEGKLAFCDYRILKIEAQKARIVERGDPQRKLKARIEKAKARLADLEKKLASA